VTTPVSATPATTPVNPAEEQRRAQMRQAAEGFEAIFLRQMIGSMRQARLAEDVFGSQATEQFRDMGDAQLAESMAKQRSFGIAEMLLNQFQRSGGPR